MWQLSRDINNNIPLYKSIYFDLLDKISNGTYEKGSQLPSETRLQEHYDVSRVTIRHAIELLEAENYVTKGSGSGTFVRNTKNNLQLNGLTSFSKENINHAMSSQFIKFRRIIPDNKLVNLLKLSPKEKITRHDRIRIVDGIPVGFQRIYVPDKIVTLEESDVNSETFSLYSLFEKNNIQIKGADEVIDAVTSEKIANLLETQSTSPLIYVERYTKDTENRLIEFAQIYYRADKYQYRIHLDYM
ncbi:UTRA domain-containing protein [Pediococcus pentosaceus]|nr:UTRA domain-containing protein [Pediococcus pentosaceus]